MVATYSPLWIANANAKWQVFSDVILHKIGLMHVSPIPQLFQLSQNGFPVAILSKVVDDMFISGDSEVVENVAKRISE